jgi:protein-disulfide isomerase
MLFSYSDFHCPYCRRHATTVMNSLISEYVDEGSLRIVLREYPIPTLHPRATAAAKVAVCAGAQGQYQAMHDLLFSDQKATSDETFAAYAAQLGLDPEDFQACVDSQETAARVRADIAEGQGLGVTGTPSFVIGLSDQDNPDKVRVTRFIRGAQPLSAFNNAIDEQLKKLEAAK